MSTLRDLIVTIDFNDIDTKKLLKIDSAVDEIENSLSAMGLQIDDAGDEFKQMGRKGSDALSDVRNEAILTSLAVEELDNKMDKLDRNMYKLGFTSWGTVLRLYAVKAALVGLIAVSAPVLLAVGSLASSFAVAGMAAGAFGIVATGVLTKLFQSTQEIKKLEDKIAKSKNAKERIKAQKELAAFYDSMSGAQKGALKELTSFKHFWGGFIKQFENPVLDTFGESLKFAKNILKGLSPTIGNVANVVNKLFKEFNSSAGSGVFTKFFDWLERNGANSINTFAHTAGNFIGGFFELLQAFSPISVQFEGGLLRMSEKFKDWATNLSSSKGFQDFVEYAKQNGPVLIETVSNIWDIFKKLVKDLAPLGTEVLGALKGITGEINDNWPVVKDTVISLTGAIGSFILMMQAMKIIQSVTTFIQVWRTATLAAALAQAGLNAALWLNPITWIIAGIAALIGITILIVRHWDGFKKKTMELWDKLGPFKMVLIALGGPFVILIAAVVKLVKHWDEFKASITNFKMPKFGLPKWMGGNGLIQKADGSHATGLGRVPYDGYMAQVHKDEAILTAQQSNALRNAGMLSGDSKPNVNLGANIAPKRGNVTFAPSYDIRIEGGNGNDSGIIDKIKQVIKTENEKQWQKLQLVLEG